MIFRPPGEGGAAPIPRLNPPSAVGVAGAGVGEPKPDDGAGAPNWNGAAGAADDEGAPKEKPDDAGAGAAAEGAPNEKEAGEAVGVDEPEPDAPNEKGAAAGADGVEAEPKPEDAAGAPKPFAGAAAPKPVDGALLPAPKPVAAGVDDGAPKENPDVVDAPKPGLGAGDEPKAGVVEVFDDPKPVAGAAGVEPDPNPPDGGVEVEPKPAPVELDPKPVPVLAPNPVDAGLAAPNENPALGAAAVEDDEPKPVDGVDDDAPKPEPPEPKPPEAGAAVAGGVEVLPKLKVDVDVAGGVGAGADEAPNENAALGFSASLAGPPNENPPEPEPRPGVSAGARLGDADLLSDLPKLKPPEAGAEVDAEVDPKLKAGLSPLAVPLVAGAEGAPKENGLSAGFSAAFAGAPKLNEVAWAGLSTAGAEDPKFRGLGSILSAAGVVEADGAPKLNGVLGASAFAASLLAVAGVDPKLNRGLGSAGLSVGLEGAPKQKAGFGSAGFSAAGGGVDDGVPKLNGVFGASALASGAGDALPKSKGAAGFSAGLSPNENGAGFVISCGFMPKSSAGGGVETRGGVDEAKKFGTDPSAAGAGAGAGIDGLPSPKIESDFAGGAKKFDAGGLPAGVVDPGVSVAEDEADPEAPVREKNPSAGGSRGAFSFSASFSFDCGESGSAVMELAARGDDARGRVLNPEPRRVSGVRPMAPASTESDPPV